MLAPQGERPAGSSFLGVLKNVNGLAKDAIIVEMCAWLSKGRYRNLNLLKTPRLSDQQQHLAPLLQNHQQTMLAVA